jgi:hypothetical protein
MANLNFSTTIALLLLSVTCGNIPRSHHTKISNYPCLKLRGGEGFSSEQPTFGSEGQVLKEVPPFGWDQDKEHVELYILVNGTSTAWGERWKEHIQLHISPRSIRVTVYNLYGRHFELLLDGLYEEIATTPTKFQPQRDSVHIKFKKVIFVHF